MGITGNLPTIKVSEKALTSKQEAMGALTLNNENYQEFSSYENFGDSGMKNLLPTGLFIKESDGIFKFRVSPSKTTQRNQSFALRLQPSDNEIPEIKLVYNSKYGFYVNDEKLIDQVIVF